MKSFDFIKKITSILNRNKWFANSQKRVKTVHSRRGMRLYNKGLTVGTWGNLSIRDPETNLVYIKPSGMNYPEIQVDDIVVMNDKTQIVEGHRKPSVEFNFHIAIMTDRKDVNCVLSFITKALKL